MKTPFILLLIDLPPIRIAEPLLAELPMKVPSIVEFLTLLVISMAPPPIPLATLLMKVPFI